MYNKEDIEHQLAHLDCSDDNLRSVYNVLDYLMREVARLSATIKAMEAADADED